MTTHKYIKADQGGALSGEFGCENFGPDPLDQPALLLPIANSLPEIGYDNSQVVYIPNSGILAITHEGSWKLKSADSTFIASPHNISGLVAWYSANGPMLHPNGGTLTGASGNVANGINNWQDVGPSGYHLTQVEEPDFVASGLNDLPEADFNGSADALSGTFPALLGYTIFAVAKLDGVSANNKQIVGRTQDDPWKHNFWMVLDANEQLTVGHYSDDDSGLHQSVSTMVFDTTNYYILAGRRDDGGAGISLYANGSGLALGTDTAAGEAIKSDTTLPLNFGQQYAGDGFFPGRIKEVLIYDHGLTDTEVNAINQYLSQKFGIVGSG